MAGLLVTGQARRRGNVAFDPLSEPNFPVEAWWTMARASVSAGRIVSVASRGPLVRNLTRVSGSIGPAYVASRADLGHKPAAVLTFDNTTLQTMECTTLSMSGPFTVIFAGTQDVTLVGQTPEQRRQQFMMDYAGRQYILSYQQGTGEFADYMLANCGNQVQLGFKLTGKSFVTAFYCGAGAATACYNSSPTPDSTDNLGTATPLSTMTLFGHRNANPNYVWAGAFADIFVIRGGLSYFTMSRLMLWLKSEYYIPISFDDPGRVFRKKFYFNTNGGQLSADSFPFPFVSPVESMVSPSKAIRAKFRWQNSQDGVKRTSPECDVSQGSTWYSGRVADGSHTFHAGGVDYKTLLGEAYGNADSNSPATVERIIVMGGGQLAKFAFRDDPTLPFVELPFEPGTTIPDFAPTGKMDLGGNRAISSGSPLVGFVREIQTYTDGALPPEFTPPTYTAGSILFIGSGISSMTDSAGWPAFTIQLLVAGGRNSYPLPRQKSALQTWGGLLAARSTLIDPYFVTGGLNIAIVTEGLYSIANAITASGTAASVNADNAAMVNALISSGWTVINCTTPPYGATGATETMRLDVNALMRATPVGILADVGAITTAAFTLYGGSTPSTVSAKLMAAIVAPILAARLP
jgi:hypothetical protein